MLAVVAFWWSHSLRTCFFILDVVLLASCTSCSWPLELIHASKSQHDLPHEHQQEELIGMTFLVKAYDGHSEDTEKEGKVSLMSLLNQISTIVWGYPGRRRTGADP